MWQSQNNFRWSSSWCPIHWLRFAIPYLSSCLVDGSCLLGNSLDTWDSVLWWSMIRGQYVFESSSGRFTEVQEVSSCLSLPSGFRLKVLSVACSQLRLWIDLVASKYARILSIVFPMISDQHLISYDFLLVLGTIYSWAFSQLLGLSRTDFNIMCFLFFNWSTLAMVHCHWSYQSMSSLPVDVSISLACSSNFPDVWEVLPARRKSWHTIQTVSLATPSYDAMPWYTWSSFLDLLSSVLKDLWNNLLPLALHKAPVVHEYTFHSSSKVRYGPQAVGCSHAIDWNASRDTAELQAQSSQLAPSVKPPAPKEFFQIALSNVTGAMMWTWWNSWISCWSSRLDIASLHDQELASITKKLYWRFFQRYSFLDMHDLD